MIDGAPKIMLDAVYANENLVDMPAPERMRPSVNASFLDLRGEHWSEAMLPEPDGLVADIYATFEENVLDLAERQWETDVHHHREVDNLGRTVEAAERISHPQRLCGGVGRLKLDCSDTAL